MLCTPGRRMRSLALLGIPSFPCLSMPSDTSRDKKPLTSNGFYDATIDHSTHAQWERRWPNALVGVPTGKPSGIAVLDLDIIKHPKTAGAWLAANKSRLPNTRRHRTQ